MMNKNLVNITYLITVLLISCAKTEPKYVKLNGRAFGTSFHINFQNEDLRKISYKIDSVFTSVNNSLSTYHKHTDISKINRGDTTVTIDANFKEVFFKSKKIHQQTKGVFDPTIGVLVNAWGFGPKKGMQHLDQKTIDSLLVYVGFDKVHIQNNSIQKLHPQTFLDFNAIAKGFAVDLMGRFFEAHGIENYMVEIGGEIRARGKNEKGQAWRVGIENPNFDGTRSLRQVVILQDEAMATSGNYRKFKVDAATGKKYVHTVNTQTGYAEKSDLLSASVIGKYDCADLDAYATAFVAMGYQKAKEFLKEQPNLKVYFIYATSDGNIENYANFPME